MFPFPPFLNFPPFPFFFFFFFFFWIFLDLGNMPGSRPHGCETAGKLQGDGVVCVPRWNRPFDSWLLQGVCQHESRLFICLFFCYLFIYLFPSPLLDGELWSAGLLLIIFAHGSHRAAMEVHKSLWGFVQAEAHTARATWIRQGLQQEGSDIF